MSDEKKDLTEAQKDAVWNRLRRGLTSYVCSCGAVAAGMDNECVCPSATPEVEP